MSQPQLRVARRACVKSTICRTSPAAISKSPVIYRRSALFIDTTARLSAEGYCSGVKNCQIQMPDLYGEFAAECGPSYTKGRRKTEGRFAARQWVTVNNNYCRLDTEGLIARVNSCRLITRALRLRRAICKCGSESHEMVLRICAPPG